MSLASSVRGKRLLLSLRKIGENKSVTAKNEGLQNVSKRSVRVSQM